MPESSGLTPFALVFMLVSMGTVTALMVYCFYRILTGGGTAAERGGGTAAEGGGTPPPGGTQR